MTMTEDELKAALDAHVEWVEWRGEKGKQFVHPEIDLSGLNLCGATLIRAIMHGANLVETSLVGVRLRQAELIGANLQFANLNYAICTRADFSGADLSCAELCCIKLRSANLRGANLWRANLGGADLLDADLRGATLPAGVPVIENIDARIAEAVGENGEHLYMDEWHLNTPCGTSHCRAGWAITLAGDKGSILERLYGPEVAGTLIYAASRPDKKHPDFFINNKAALASIKEDASQAL